MILVYLGRWSYGRFKDDNNIFYKMKNDLTTGTWQDDVWCPIIIILLCTSDDIPQIMTALGGYNKMSQKSQRTFEKKSAFGSNARKGADNAYSYTVYFAVAISCDV
jgi:hypothetical protein